ncbi:alpha-L-arabinofuranosidase [Actinoplanes sp. SE50]|uniref:sigma-70 family RNA polymerase sigma factor n=1 Tax=unclassified Actinoplanes TaxID=2626549 RepID=UPI00023ED406|nr:MULTISPECIES: sigma-70 family RNA polymerase sigma factor [unclassified Actinoplanes]AEV83899.1 RNA polymerase, sigma-24 subunit, ECF subfamily [Actinoplanes sp. SE50/110]ATO81957.1 alpha-L-arabinofuranosidase [Actinoplanes sp. SE50]SLL99365.1 alpha-L-arabinofuranosidase [Actinoplanes sp. SE50/110]
MAATRTDAAGLVRAAQAGNRAARDELVGAYLPVVYTIVRQALDTDPDVDDVAQDIMLRVLRQLRSLRSPDSFRSWLVAIALRQVSTHQHRRARDAARAVPIDEAAGVPDVGAEFEGVTGLRADLSAQRRQVRRAGRWLDPDDRSLLSLWLLEASGHLTRAELADALGVTVVHAGVRVQRMRAQLEVSRAIVAALDAEPRCPRLGAELAGWPGTPGPRWRKRLARHVRGCPVCTRAAGDLVPAERLLPGLLLLPVPAALTATVLAKSVGAGAVLSVAAGKAGVFGQLAALAAAHPVVTAVTAGTLIVGATAGAVSVTAPEVPRPATIARTPQPATIAAPAPVTARATTGATRGTTPRPAGTGTLRAGPVSLEAANATGRYITAAGSYGMLIGTGRGGPAATRQPATFRAVAGLNDQRCFSFRAADGRYLRHASWRLRLNADDGTALFRGDATFCPGAGQAAGSITLESSNYPGWFLRHRGDELWVDQFDGSAAFRADGSFLVRPGLAG